MLLLTQSRNVPFLQGGRDYMVEEADMQQRPFRAAHVLFKRRQ